MLTFEFKTIEEAKRFLESLPAGQPAPPIPVAPGLPPVAGRLPQDPAPEPEVKKPKRKKTEPAPAAYTIEDVRAKMQELFENKGRDALAAVLKSIGAESVSKINPDQYSEAVKLADEALAK